MPQSIQGGGGYFFLPPWNLFVSSHPKMFTFYRQGEKRPILQKDALISQNIYPRKNNLEEPFFTFLPFLFQRSLKFLFIHFFFFFERDLFLPPLPYILFGSEILPTNGSFVRGGDPTSPTLKFLFTVISAPPPTQRRLCRAQFHRRGISVKISRLLWFAC